MPFAYIVTFTVSTPEYDTSTGKIKTETVTDADDKTIVRDKYNVLTDPETLEFFYAIVSMPADTSYTVKSSGITTNADGKSAIVQLADQERISVGIKQINSSIAPTGITADSLRSGSTLKTVATVSSVNSTSYGSARHMCMRPTILRDPRLSQAMRLCLRLLTAQDHYSSDVVQP